MNIAQADRNKESFISSFPEIRPEIAEYVFDWIVPQYAAFDPAHREDHAWDVIENSMDLYRRAPEEVRGVLDPEIIFVAAACHDLGRIKIGQIAEAAEDHRASLDYEPRSMYGKIVAEADRLIDSGTIIRRTLQYGMSRYPELSPQEQIDRALDHLYDKYGPGGYLKLWIPWSDNASRLERLRMLLDDRAAARKEVERLYHETAGGPAAGI